MSAPIPRILAHRQSRPFLVQHPHHLLALGGREPGFRDMGPSLGRCTANSSRLGPQPLDAVGKAIAGCAERFLDRQRRRFRHPPRRVGGQRAGAGRAIPTTATTAIRGPASQVDDRPRGQQHQQAVRGPTAQAAAPRSANVGRHGPPPSRLPLHEPCKIGRCIRPHFLRPRFLEILERFEREALRFLRGIKAALAIEEAEIMLPCHRHRNGQDGATPNRRAVADLSQPHQPHQQQPQPTADQQRKNQERRPIVLRPHRQACDRRAKDRCGEHPDAAPGTPRSDRPVADVKRRENCAGCSFFHFFLLGFHRAVEGQTAEQAEVDHHDGREEQRGQEDGQPRLKLRTQIVNQRGRCCQQTAGLQVERQPGDAVPPQAG